MVLPIISKRFPTQTTFWIFHLRFSLLSHVSFPRPPFLERPCKASLQLLPMHLKCYSISLDPKEIPSSMSLLTATQTLPLTWFNNWPKSNHGQRPPILITVKVDLRMWLHLIWKYDPRMVGFNGNSPKPLCSTPAEFGRSAIFCTLYVLLFWEPVISYQNEKG